MSETMTTPKPLETPDAGKQLRLTGMERAAEKYRPDLVRAQLIAEMLGMGGASVTSDMVREEFLKHYQRELQIGNALGSLFDSDRWEFVSRIRSKRRQAHGRFICTWRLKGKA